MPQAHLSREEVHQLGWNNVLEWMRQLPDRGENVNPGFTLQ